MTLTCSYKIQGVEVKSDVKERRKAINNLATSMLAMTDKQVECPVEHRFAKGCYAREMLIPKDTTIVGKIHATEHFNIILTGDVTVVTATTRERIKAPHVFVTGEGIQKVVYAHEDCRWLTIHVTEETDLAKIEEQTIVESYEQLLVDSLLRRLG